MIVLDNAEHVLDSVRAMARAIVATCPDIQLLVTSREPLGVPMEVVHRVEPLRTETAATGAVDVSPAVQLLGSRIAASGVDLMESDATRARLEAVAQSLDGLPLALELAAGRVATLGLVELENRLDQHLAVLTDRGASQGRHAKIGRASCRERV